MLLSPNHRRSLGIISVAGHKLLVFFLLGNPNDDGHFRDAEIFVGLKAGVSIVHFKKELVEYLHWYNEKRIKKRTVTFTI